MNPQLSQLSGLRFQIDYPDFSFENQYLDEKTIVWKSINGPSMTGKAAGEEVTEQATVINLAMNQFLVSWVEESGLGVTQHLNFSSGQIHSLIRDDKNIIAETGKLTILN